MDYRPAIGFFLGMAAILAGGAIAAMFAEAPSASNWMAAVAAVAAGVQAIVAGVMMRGLRHAQTQAAAAQESVAIIERTAERQLRAYVHVTSVTYQAPANAGGNPWIVIVVRNVGQTPAYDVMNLTQVFAVPPALLETLEWDGATGSTNSQGSLGSACEDVLKLEVKDTDAFRKGIASGALLRVLVGRISYRDVFGRSRETGFACQALPGDDLMHTSTRYGRTPGNYAT